MTPAEAWAALENAVVDGGPLYEAMLKRTALTIDQAFGLLDDDDIAERRESCYEIEEQENRIRSMDPEDVI